MQFDVHKILYSFYSTKKIYHVTATVKKCASLAAIARCITIIYANRPSANFQSGIRLYKERLPRSCNETTYCDFILLSKTRKC